MTLAQIIGWTLLYCAFWFPVVALALWWRRKRDERNAKKWARMISGRAYGRSPVEYGYIRHAIRPAIRSIAESQKTFCYVCGARDPLLHYREIDHGDFVCPECYIKNSANLFKRNHAKWLEENEAAEMIDELFDGDDGP